MGDLNAQYGNLTSWQQFCLKVYQRWKMQNPPTINPNQWPCRNNFGQWIIGLHSDDSTLLKTTLEYVFADAWEEEIKKRKYYVLHDKIKCYIGDTGGKAAIYSKVVSTILPTILQPDYFYGQILVPQDIIDWAVKTADIYIKTIQCEEVIP